MRQLGKVTASGQQLLLAFVTLVALLAMHGVGTHDGPGMAGMPMAAQATTTTATAAATGADAGADADADASPRANYNAHIAANAASVAGMIGHGMEGTAQPGKQAASSSTASTFTKKTDSKPDLNARVSPVSHGMSMAGCLAIVTISLLALALIAAARRRLTSRAVLRTLTMQALGTRRRRHPREPLSFRRLAPTLTQLCILQA